MRAIAACGIPTRVRSRTAHPAYTLVQIQTPTALASLRTLRIRGRTCRSLFPLTLKGRPASLRADRATHARSPIIANRGMLQRCRGRVGKPGERKESNRAAARGSQAPPIHSAPSSCGGYAPGSIPDGHQTSRSSKSPAADDRLGLDTSRPIRSSSAFTWSRTQVRQRAKAGPRFFALKKPIHDRDLDDGSTDVRTSWRDRRYVRQPP